MSQKVVLAYSGGLDTSVIAKWLSVERGLEVVTFTADLGQGEELEPARAKAELMGVKPEHIYIDDLREEFARDYVFPMFRANALYEGVYLLGTSIARPLIAKRQIEIARQVGADAVCHGATGKGNDQVRFDLAVKAQGDFRIVAPIREIQKEHTQTRAYEQAYLEERGFGVRAKQQAYTINENLLGLTMSGGEIDRWEAPGEGARGWCAPRAEWPEAPLQVTLRFEQGTAVALDGESLPGAQILAKLNADEQPEIAGQLSQMFGVRSIPFCVMFKDGQPVDGFAGAQPESAIRAMLEPHVQAPASPQGNLLESAEAAFAEGRFAEAEAQLQQLLSEDNENAAGLIAVEFPAMTDGRRTSSQPSSASQLGSGAQAYESAS